MPEDLMYTSDGRLIIRKSMLETFMFCPMKFRKEYIEGIPSTSHPYMMSMGTRFHEFANWFFDICDGIDPDRWIELVPNKFTVEEREMANWFIEREYLRYNDDPELFMPVMRETKIIDETLGLMGTFDRIDKIDGDGHLAIVEYKTGKSFNKKSIMRQLAFYKLLWDNNMKYGTITHARYINPRIQMYEIIPFTQNDTDRLLADISSMREAIREDKFKLLCSPVKYTICHMCDIDECGVYDYAKRS